MTEMEKRVARVLAMEFVRTGVVDCRRMARLACKAMLATKPAKKNKKGNKTND